MNLTDYISTREPSIEAFVRKANVGRSTIRRLMAGRPATLRVAKAVSNATGGLVPVIQLLEGAA